MSFGTATRLAQSCAHSLKKLSSGSTRLAHDGNLYATDIAIRDDEFLDWTKPLDEQPRAVQSVLASP